MIRMTLHIEPMAHEVHLSDEYTEHTSEWLEIEDFDDEVPDTWPKPMPRVRKQQRKQGVTIVKEQ